MDRMHFTELANCAVRYALGRSTYVSCSVPDTIKSNLNLMTTNGLKTIVRDIEEFKHVHGRIGMECDDESWMKLKECCEKEIRERQWETDMHPDAITARKYMAGDPETLKRLGIFDP